MTNGHYIFCTLKTKPSKVSSFILSWQVCLMRVFLTFLVKNLLCFSTGISSEIGNLKWSFASFHLKSETSKSLLINIFRRRIKFQCKPFSLRFNIMSKMFFKKLLLGFESYKFSAICQNLIFQNSLVTGY